ncbi:hypothetical protein BJV82DRAFT_667643 [Fennellomyces sp. T-0311]|nr:hypothetical protein BJV82DRAFT_667643 [Fennellomyces sp. T-0311]
MTFYFCLTSPPVDAIVNHCSGLFKKILTDTPPSYFYTSNVPDHELETFVVVDAEDAAENKPLRKGCAQELIKEDVHQKINDVELSKKCHQELAKDVHRQATESKSSKQCQKEPAKQGASETKPLKKYQQEPTKDTPLFPAATLFHQKRYNRFHRHFQSQEVEMMYRQAFELSNKTKKRGPVKTKISVPNLLHQLPASQEPADKFHNDAIQNGIFSDYGVLVEWPQIQCSKARDNDFFDDAVLVEKPGTHKEVKINICLPKSSLLVLCHILEST